MALTVASPLKCGTLDIFLCSNLTHRSTGNQYNDRTSTHSQFSIRRTACHTAVLKLLPTFVAKFTFDEKLWLPKANTENSTDTDGVQHNTMFVCVCLCVCGMSFWLRDLKWLNYTPETMRNSPYRFQRTLIICEYAKHHHFKSG